MATARSLRRVSGQGFATRIVSAVRTVRRLSPSGLVLPATEFLTVERPRVDATMVRIAKAIHYHHTGTRIPQAHQVIPRHIEGLRTPRKPSQEIELENFFLKYLDTAEERTIGGQDFRYRFYEALPPSRGSAFQFEFFQILTYLVLVTPRNDGA